MWRLIVTTEDERRSLVFLLEASDQLSTTVFYTVIGSAGEVDSGTVRISASERVTGAKVVRLPFPASWYGVTKIEGVGDSGAKGYSEFDRRLQLSGYPGYPLVYTPLSIPYQIGQYPLPYAYAPDSYAEIFGPYGFPYSETPYSVLPPVQGSLSPGAAGAPSDVSALTDRERERIRLEEIYRAEIRNELRKKPEKGGRWKRLTEFLNSALGLWLLSTFFVTLLTWGWAQYSGRLEHQRQRERDQSQLTLELWNRVEALQRADAPQFPSRFRDVMRGALYGTHEGLQEHPTWKIFYAGIFPAYSERSLRSIVVQLADLRGKPAAEALDAVDTLEALMEELETVNTETLRLPPTQRMIFHAKLSILRRWNGIPSALDGDR